MAALAPFRDTITSHDLDFVSLGEFPERFRRRTSSQGPRFTGVLGRVGFWAVYQRLLTGYLDAFTTACNGADLIVYTGLAFPAFHVAEALKVPCASLAFVPGIPTHAFVNPLFARRGLSWGRWNRTSHLIEHFLMMQSSAHNINAWRQRQLGLATIPRAELLEHRWAQTDAVIISVSATLIPRPPDWGPQIYLTGHLAMNPSDTSPIDPALQAFIEDGPMPVYIGFGSMTGTDGQRLANAVIAALDRRGLRGVLATGWGGLQMKRDELPRHIHIIEDAPHAWLLPRSRCAVHHGGAGTTIAALSSGVPSVIVPFDYDQRFWGYLLAERGLGPAPIPRNRLTTDRLDAALQALDSDHDRTERVRSVAAALRQEDGVGNAVAVLEGLTAR